MKFSQIDTKSLIITEFLKMKQYIRMSAIYTLQYLQCPGVSVVKWVKCFADPSEWSIMTMNHVSTNCPGCQYLRNASPWGNSLGGTLRFQKLTQTKRNWFIYPIPASCALEVDVERVTFEFQELLDYIWVTWLCKLHD